MSGLKLDLGAGNRPTPGFKSVDLVGEPDFQVDLFQYPWPWKDRSVSEVVSNHLIEHIPHYRPEYNGVDGFWMFFNELHRVMRKNGKVTLQFPYGRTDRALWDPSHTRYIHEVSFNYLNPAWLEQQGLQHYPITANFEIVNMSLLGVPEVIMNRTQEMQDQARMFYWNFCEDMHVILEAKK